MISRGGGGFCFSFLWFCRWPPPIIIHEKNSFLLTIGLFSLGAAITKQFKKDTSLIYTQRLNLVCVGGKLEKDCLLAACTRGRDILSFCLCDLCWSTRRTVSAANTNYLWRSVLRGITMEMKLFSTCVCVLMNPLSALCTYLSVCVWEREYERVNERERVWESEWEKAFVHPRVPGHSVLRSL